MKLLLKLKLYTETSFIRFGGTKIDDILDKPNITGFSYDKTHEARNTQQPHFFTLALLLFLTMKVFSNANIVRIKMCYVVKFETLGVHDYFYGLTRVSG